MNNAVNWFEIFVADLTRAAAFYERVLQISLKREDFAGMPQAIFTRAGGNPDNVGGALVKHPERGPSAEGVMVYLNVTGQLDAVLGRIEAAGGKVVMPKTDIGDPGFIALMRDTEGNVVGLHSPR